jgi:hypothetical protein
VPSELCPSCREVREMTVVSEIHVENHDGHKKTTRTDTFHCATCQSFVRSETHDSSETTD